MYLELAKKYLIKSKEASGTTRSYFANLTKVCLAKCGGTPADIGTTEEELVQLTNKNIRQKKVRRHLRGKDNCKICKEYLEKCRQNDCTNRQYFANLCQTTLVKYNLTPEDIGTTSEELNNLQNQGFLESAQKYLEQARVTEGARRKCYADLCTEYLNKGKGVPGDIGTGEEELAELMK